MDERPVEIIEYGLVGEFPYVITKHTGLGHLCGYLAVPPKHPWYKPEDIYDNDIDVHGGITYTNESSSDEDAYPMPLLVDAYWVGFDCAHYMDVTPYMGYNSPGATYKDRDYVYNEIEGLASQAAAAYNQIEGEKCLLKDSNPLP